FEEVADAIRDLSFDIDEFHVKIHRAFEPDATTTFGKLIDKHKDKVERLRDTYRRLEEKIKNTDGATKVLLDRLKNIGLEIDFQEKSLIPKFQLEFVMKDIDEGLREAGKALRMDRILSEFLTGKAALQAQKVNAEKYAATIVNTIYDSIRNVAREQGIFAALALFGMVPENLREVIKVAIEHENDLLKIQEGYFDRIDEMRERDIEKFRVFEQTKADILRDLADEAEMERRNRLTENQRQLEFAAEREFFIFEDQLKRRKQTVDELTRYSFEHDKMRFLSMATMGSAVMSIEKQIALFAKAMTDDRANRAHALRILLENIAKSTLAGVLESISGEAKAKAALAALDAAVAFFHGRFAEAAGLAKAAAGYAALAGVTAGLAGSIRSNIQTFNRPEEREIGDTTTTTRGLPSGILTQPIGGLDLGPRPQPQPQPSVRGISTTVNFSAETIFIGNEVVDDPTAIKRAMKTAIVEIVNEEMETGNINS
ncbi:MAG: hypothetical protein QQN41_07955, partial [Nitrosopumilus sp.]